MNGGYALGSAKEIVHFAAETGAEVWNYETLPWSYTVQPTRTTTAPNARSDEGHPDRGPLDRTRRANVARVSNRAVTPLPVRALVSK